MAVTGTGAGQPGNCNGDKQPLQMGFNGSEMAMQQETKPASQSLTIIANLLTVVALLLGLAYKEFGPAQQTAFVQAGSAIAAAALQVISIWGRMRATQRIVGVVQK